MSDPLGQTSLHLRRARAGDRASLNWLVDRLSPLLLAQARYRLGTRLGHVCDPEDLVQDTWTVALPRLGDLEARDGRETPVLIRFLATTLLQRVNNLARRHIRRTALGPAAERAEPAAPQTGAVTRAARSETYSRVMMAVEELSPDQREVFILRGVEQLDNVQVALRLGITPNAASLRWTRALAELRQRLPGAVFDELD